MWRTGPMSPRARAGCSPTGARACGTEPAPPASAPGGLAPVRLVRGRRPREAGRRPVPVAQSVRVGHRVEVGFVGDVGGVGTEEAVHVVDVDRVVRHRVALALVPHPPLGDAELLAVRPRDGEPGAEAPGAVVERDVVVLVPERLRVLLRTAVVVMDADDVDHVVAGVEVERRERRVLRLLGAGPLDLKAGAAALERGGRTAPAPFVVRDLVSRVDAPGVVVGADVRLPAQADNRALGARSLELVPDLAPVEVERSGPALRELSLGAG